VYWGDNLTHQTWSAESVIRIEHVLSAASGATLTGYNMTYLYGTGPDEMQGTDGTTGSFVPTMYSVVPRLTIEKLDAEGGNPVYTAFDGAVYEHIGVDGPGGYGAEVNVAGKVIYGYNLMMKRINMPAGVPKDGWWRITFSLDQSASVGGVSVSRNLSLDDLGNTAAGEELVYTPQLHPSGTRTWMDIFVTESPGGGGPGGGGGGSGGGGSGGGGGPP
jgi:hypothetical protein